MIDTTQVAQLAPLGVIVLGIGIFFFFRGFRDLRRKRLMEDTPTSTIRAMAPGLVEVNGDALQMKTLEGPFTRRSCVYYEYSVEEQRTRTVGSGKDQHTETYWAEIKSDDTSGIPFFVDDGTGKALIHPEGAEMTLVDKWELEPGLFEDIPGNVVSFLKTQDVDCYGLFGFKRPLRFSERILPIGQKLYLMATCQSAGENAQEMLLVRSPHKDPFIISAKSQKSLESSLGWGAFFMIPLGILFSGAGIYVLVCAWLAR